MKLNAQKHSVVVLILTLQKRDSKNKNLTQKTAIICMKPLIQGL